MVAAMRRAVWFALGYLACGVFMLAGVAWAAEGPQCYIYRAQYPRVAAPGGTAVGEGPSASAACSALAGQMASGTTNNNFSYTSNGASGETSSGFLCSLQQIQVYQGNTYNSTINNIPGAKVPTDCPFDPCEEFVGQEYRAMQAFPDYPDAGADYRNPSNNNCKMSVKGMTCTAIPGGQYCLMTYEYQATRDDELEEAANQPGECAIVAGKRNCGLKEDGSGNDCAVIGGERVCFEGSVADEGAGPAPSGCWTTGSGGLLCGEDVELQDSEGDPVQPDSSVRTTNNTWNFYGAGTVADRGVTQGTDGSTPDTAEQGEDGGACPDGGNCSGELGEMTEVDSFGELTQAFMDRVAAAPVVASVSNLGDALPAGSCPELEMELFGQTLSFSAPMCTIWNSIAPILSAVMLVAWGLLAARIVLSA